MILPPTVRCLLLVTNSLDLLIIICLRILKFQPSQLVLKNHTYPLQRGKKHFELVFDGQVQDPNPLHWQGNEFGFPTIKSLHIQTNPHRTAPIT